MHHADLELFGHLFLYALHMPLLEWRDAFLNCIWIAALVSATRITAFAGKLGMSFMYIELGEARIRVRCRVPASKP